MSGVLDTDLQAVIVGKLNSRNNIGSHDREQDLGGKVKTWIEWILDKAISVSWVERLGKIIVGYPYHKKIIFELIKRLIRMSIVTRTRVASIPTAKKPRHAQTRRLVNEGVIGSQQADISTW